MESRAKLFGHPLHTMLIVFPLGLLGMSVIFDLVGLFVENGGSWHESAFRMIGAGVIGGLLAALPGAVDWWAIPFGTRAKAIGMWHGLGNVAVTALFTISWLMRNTLPASAPGAIPIVLGVIGLGLAVVTGWLGGELVDRLGVGVDRGAHLNAPSSLSKRPATDDASAAVQQTPG